MGHYNSGSHQSSALGFIFFSGVMRSKYSEYYKQMMEAKEYPVKISGGGNLYRAMQSFVLRKKLELTVRHKTNLIIINKKADA